MISPALPTQADAALLNRSLKKTPTNPSIRSLCGFDVDRAQQIYRSGHTDHNSHKHRGRRLQKLQTNIEVW